MTDVERPRVALFRGGPSGEREISLQSAAAVKEALIELRIPSMDVLIREDGLASVDDAAPLRLESALATIRDGSDLVFPALHGTFGEDGVLQGLLDSAGIPYVGSGVCASSVAMDKGLSRRIAENLGYSIAPAVEGGPDTDDEAVSRLAHLVMEIPRPWFVKPACSGSSVGVSRIEDPGLLKAALLEGLAESDRVVVESGISGMEVSCPVLGDAHADPEALDVIEIVPRDSVFFDYKAKYTVGEADEICPARIPAPLAARLRRAATDLHNVFGCLDLSRSDFIVRDDGGEGEIVFLELNTLPGITKVSLFPKAATAAGMTYADLIGRLIEGAWRRARGRGQAG